MSLDGAILRLDPDTGAARRQPAAGERAQRIVAQGLRNPFRIAVRPGTSEVWAATSAGTRGRRSTARAGGGVPQLRLAVLRGRRAHGHLASSTTRSARASTARRGAHTAPHYAYHHGAKVVAGERARPARSSISGLAFYDGGSSRPSTTARCSSPTTRAAAPGRCCRRQRAAGPGADPDVRHRRPVGRPAGRARRRRCSTSTSAGRSGGSGRSTATGPRPRGRPRRPTAGPRRSPSTLDGARLDRSRRRRRSTYAWDLDGDGAYDDGSAAAPVRVSGTDPVRLRVRDRERAGGLRPGPRAPGHPARRGDRRARRGHDVGGRRQDRVSAAAGRPGPARRCPRAR